jgi:hypothetical protein
LDRNRPNEKILPPVIVDALAAGTPDIRYSASITSGRSGGEEQWSDCDRGSRPKNFPKIFWALTVEIRHTPSTPRGGPEGCLNITEYIQPNSILAGYDNRTPTAISSVDSGLVYND